MAKKVRFTADQLTQRFQNGLASAGQSYQDGVSAVESAPGQAAAQQADLWLQNIQKSKDKWKKNVSAVTLDQWQAAAIQKGAPALTNSAPLAAQKYSAKAGKLISTINQGLSTLPPRGTTLEQNMARTMHMAKALQKGFSS